MEFISLVLNFVPQLLKHVYIHTGYVCDLIKNMNSLITENLQLLELRNDTQTRVNIALDRNMKPKEQVLGWLKRVEEFQEQKDSISREVEAVIQRKSICRYCSKTTYKLGKKVSQKLQELINLKSGGAFEVVADPGFVVDRVPLDETVGLNDTFEEVWSCITNAEKNIIGIWGIGGVGKTTLLKKVSNKLEGFDTVIWIVVSKNQSLETVQDTIGRKLDLWNDIWKDKSMDEKANCITTALSRKTFVILLDDLWSKLDFLKIGVPLPNEQKQSKILFTTRSEDVCRSMQAHMQIKVKCLSGNDSWTLFKSKVGEEILMSHPKILNLAKDVVEKCCGLPLALITIGLAMASKRTPEEWEHAKETLTSTSKEVLHILKYSYDSLPDETIKSCFLFCSSFPDSIIYKIELINLWIGEGYFDKCKSISDAVNLGHSIIGKLQVASLLEIVEWNSYDYGITRVKMHDMMREMALWIVAEHKRQKFFALADVEKIEDLESIEWKKADKVSIQRSRMKKLETFNCPNLSTLYIRESRFTKIPDTFFQYMPILKVLVLSSSRLRVLPRSFFELVSLEFLDLSSTFVDELSIEFSNLQNLKHLYLNHMLYLYMAPKDLFRSSSQLKRLALLFYGTSTDDDVECSLLSRDGNASLVDKLENLRELQTLDITLKSKIAVQNLVSSQKLLTITNGLEIRGCEGLTSGSELLSLPAAGLTRLYITSCEDLQDLNMECKKEGNRVAPDLSNMDGCFAELRKLNISGCHKLKDVTFIARITSLERLNISNCRSIEEVIRGETDAFSRLKWLGLRSLPRLEIISSHPLPFPVLVTVMVNNCPNLKRLPFTSDSAKMTLKRIKAQKEWWEKLEWEDEVSSSLFAPFLT